MPAPPARRRSLRVPWGFNSTCNAPLRTNCSKSLFSPTYVEIIFLTCRCWSSTPMPKSSTPALLLTMVRSFTPLRRTAAIRFSGMPQSPKPPIRIVAPSRTFAMAASADAMRLSIPCSEVQGGVYFIGPRSRKAVVAPIQTRESRKHTCSSQRQLLFRQGFPQLDAVAVGVHDPPKLSVVVFVDLRVHPDTFLTQRLQRRVKIVHDVIHHRAGFTLAKVRRCGRKNTPRRAIILGRTVWLSPREHGPSVALANNTKMPGVPRAQGFWIFRLKENTANAADTFHAAYATRLFPWNQRASRNRAESR